MNEADALDLVHSAIWTILIAAGPAVAAAMLVGLLVAFFQALTQVQEVTLTFIPKIVAVLAAAAVTGSFMGAQIMAFTQEIYGHIATGY
ncbi:flagellar biosynthesis protein FliQ [Aquabacter sp. P-9]|uniref:flagellar biosynthesis protein FliQ n=1 Tax=Aquabacter sediminis TaxID=3029197 RepID=UPI00237DDE3E|nr:flagellar biosynthesis protein FliQ [Aquabacter sp. P-9]MDE1571064.1 flagellar biosynthesis protein FliQ [Aquabacter sp. P-9]